MIKVAGGPPQMFMQQGGIPMSAVRSPNMGGGNIGVGGGGGAGMPMGNFAGPNVLPGPLAFLEKTTSNIGIETELKIFFFTFIENILI